MHPFCFNLPRCAPLSSAPPVVLLALRLVFPMRHQIPCSIYRLLFLIFLLALLLNFLILVSSFLVCSSMELYLTSLSRLILHFTSWIRTWGSIPQTLAAKGRSGTGHARLAPKGVFLSRPRVLGRRHSWRERKHPASFFSCTLRYAQRCIRIIEICSATTLTVFFSRVCYVQ